VDFKTIDKAMEMDQLFERKSIYFDRDLFYRLEIHCICTIVESDIDSRGFGVNDCSRLENQNEISTQQLIRDPFSLTRDHDTIGYLRASTALACYSERATKAFLFWSFHYAAGKVEIFSPDGT
jgi:hypothetical protein